MKIEMFRGGHQSILLVAKTMDLLSTLNHLKRGAQHQHRRTQRKLIKDYLDYF